MENRNKIRHRKKIVVTAMLCATAFFVLSLRLCYLMIARSEYYVEQAEKLHERERNIKAARGKIFDRNGVVLADNKTVCTISVIHSQIEDKEKVIKTLCRYLQLSEDYIRKRVEKVSSMEKIKSNVSKEVGDQIRNVDLPGIKVDEDFKRYYPFDNLASKVLGFTGADNQGIIGLEVKYDSFLSGTEGQILALTDARGIEIEQIGEKRKEPIPGNDLYTSLDYTIQSYAEQLCHQTMEEKNADRVSMIVMNPQNGEIYAMTDIPEFHLNDPYTITEEYRKLLDKKQLEQGKNNLEPETTEIAEETAKENKQETELLLNGMWRNGCISDTYEPGSTFKTVTASAALEEGVVSCDDTFYCPGYVLVGDRRIRCAKIAGHGNETFVQGTMNSCNPVFVTVGLRVGPDKYYQYLKRFGILDKTGIDLPGEAGTIMHEKKSIGEVELATMSFGQSFQITPIQLATTVSSIVNGGNRIIPHVAIKVKKPDGSLMKQFNTEKEHRILSPETSEIMQMMLEQVVENGGGTKARVEGFSVGGKTATSQTLPRGSGKYIASFVGFSPAKNPRVLALLVIHNPQGMYYGGQIAAPVIGRLFQNILPYLEK